MSNQQKQISFTLTCFSAFVLLLFSITTRAAWVKQFDYTINDWLHQSLSLKFKPILIGITTLGNPTSIVGLVLVVCLVCYYYKLYSAAGFVLFNVTIYTGLNHVIKSLVTRPRPAYEHFVHAGGYSFPSGHASGSLLFWGSLWILSRYLIQNRTWRRVSTIICALLPLLIGLSRIYVQVHYPTDVLGGFLLAAGCLSLTSLAFKQQQLFPNLHD